MITVRAALISATHDPYVCHNMTVSGRMGPLFIILRRPEVLKADDIMRVLRVGSNHNSKALLQENRKHELNGRDGTHV